MLKKPLMTLLMGCLAACVVSCADKSIAGNGSQTGNPALAGVLYNADGSKAAGAIVKAVAVSYIPNSFAAKSKAFSDSIVTRTDINGNYAFDSLPANTYNIFGSGACGNLCYSDSISVSGDSLTIAPPDTLRAPGTLSGIIQLQPFDDARKVFILFLGTTVWTVPVDSIGHFTTPSMAAGTYRVEILPIPAQYNVMDTSLSITAGKNSVLADTLKLTYTGIPVPTGVSIAFDTALETATLRWNKADTGLVQSYYIYRRNVDSNTVPAMINANPVAGAVYGDSSGTEGQTYEYQVVAVDKNGNQGKMSAGVQATVTSEFAFKKLIYLSLPAYAPMFLSLTNNGGAYIADVAGEVVVADTSGTIRKKMPGFSKPAGLRATVNNEFYVVEQGTNLIKLYDSSGAVLSQFGGGGTGPGQFDEGWYCKMAINAGGEVYVPDLGNNRVQVLSPSGVYKRAFPFTAPTGIAFLSNARVVISSDFSLSTSDTNGLAVLSWGSQIVDTPALTPAGNIAVIAGTSWINSGAPGIITSVKIFIYSPQGRLVARFGKMGKGRSEFTTSLSDFTIDSSGDLYIVDEGNSQVMVFKIPNGL